MLIRSADTECVIGQRTQILLCSSPRGVIYYAGEHMVSKSQLYKAIAAHFATCHDLFNDRDTEIK